MLAGAVGAGHYVVFVALKDVWLEHVSFRWGTAEASNAAVWLKKIPEGSPMTAVGTILHTAQATDGAADTVAEVRGDVENNHVKKGELVVLQKSGGGALADLTTTMTFTERKQ